MIIRLCYSQPFLNVNEKQGTIKIVFNFFFNLKEALIVSSIAFTFKNEAEILQSYKKDIGQYADCNSLLTRL